MLKHPCKFYNTTGKCRFGKHCRYLHEQGLTISENIQKSEKQDESLKSEPLQAASTVSEHISFSDQPSKNNGSLKSQQLEREEVFDPDSLEKSTLTGQNESLNKQNRKVCRFFAKNRYCHFGRRCRYDHVLEIRRENEKPSLKVTPISEHGQHDADSEEEKLQDESQKPAVDAAEKVSPVVASRLHRKICKFYKQGYCRLGSCCRFYHPTKETDKKGVGNEENHQEAKFEGKHEKKEKPSKEPTSNIDDGFQQVIRVKPKIINVFDRNDVIPEKQQELRDTELQQLKRRFPTGKLKVVQESPECAVYIFTFMPTDPDWPFDVNSFDIKVDFGADYPLSLFKVELPLDQDLPATVRRYVEVSLQEWIAKKEEDNKRRGVVELLFRPFLRWMDRNLETVVTEGLRQLRRELTAKAAGLEFIAASDLKKEVQAQGSTDTEDFAETEDTGFKDDRRPVAYRKGDYKEEKYEAPGLHLSDEAGEEDSGEDVEDDDEDGADDGDEEKVHKRPAIAESTERHGTELVFRNMQIWYCTTVMMEKLHLTVQCERCKNRTDFSTPPNRVNLVPCSKCNNRQLVVFRPTLAHAYCSSFGYLDLEGCTGFDVILQDCHFSMGCIMCSKDILVKKFSPGRILDIFCRSCHNKMQFAADSVKLQVLTPGEVDPSKFSGSVHQVNVRRIQRVQKDPAIQEGKPLPDNGTCKHYKKSYRWLRFPCCGKCYPCDICHDDKEDHEMKFANRMICGFCCKEQPFGAEKPCTGCSSALTKVHTTHWEGGRGCRNKITMSRSDEKKYANMHKTVSNKTKAKQEKKQGAKNTKLRHT